MAGHRLRRCRRRRGCCGQGPAAAAAARLGRRWRSRRRSRRGCGVELHGAGVEVSGCVMQGGGAACGAELRGWAGCGRWAAAALKGSAHASGAADAAPPAHPPRSLTQPALAWVALGVCALEGPGMRVKGCCARCREQGAGSAPGLRPSGPCAGAGNPCNTRLRGGAQGLQHNGEPSSVLVARTAHGRSALRCHRRGWAAWRCGKKTERAARAARGRAGLASSRVGPSATSAAAAASTALAASTRAAPQRYGSTQQHSGAIETFKR